MRIRSLMGLLSALGLLVACDTVAEPGLGLFVDNPDGPQGSCDDAVPGPVGPVDRGSKQVR